MSKKRYSILKITATMILPGLWAASVGTAIAAPPRTASATVVRTGPAGNTVIRQTTASTTGQRGYTASSTITGPAGNTVTRQRSGSYNAATGTATQSRTTTGPRGLTATESRTVTVTPAPSH